MKKQNIIILSVFLVTGLAGCTTTAPEADPSYVSEEQYKGYTCPQIKAEMQRLSRKIDAAMEERKTDIAGKTLNTALGIFAISQGHGWYMSDNDSDAAERFQSQYEILEKVSIQKNCFEKK